MKQRHHSPQVAGIPRHAIGAVSDAHRLQDAVTRLARGLDRNGHAPAA